MIEEMKNMGSVLKQCSKSYLKNKLLKRHLYMCLHENASCSNKDFLINRLHITHTYVNVLFS